MDDFPSPTPHEQLAPNALGTVVRLGSAPEPAGRRTDGADIIAAISRRLAEKGTTSRLGSRTNGPIAVLDPHTLASGTGEQVIEQWLDLFDSAEQQWDAAAQLWRGGFSTPAAALALATLEESAKLAAEGFRVATVQPHSRSARGRRASPTEHHDDQVLVAVHGALANGRISRHLGEVQVHDFLGLVERGELVGLRRSCLHAHRGARGLSVPRDAVTRDRAAWIVALAGEVLAEIHFEPADWGRVLTKVDAFEQAAGIQSPDADDAPGPTRWTAPPPPIDSIRSPAR